MLVNMYRAAAFHSSVVRSRKPNEMKHLPMCSNNAIPYPLVEEEAPSSYLGVGFRIECTSDLKYRERKFAASSTRFKGSSIKMLGDFSVGANGVGKDGEWAIVGGTGDFAYAQGVVTAKLLENMGPTYHHMWELHIRVFCLCIFPEVKMMGPWGGNGGEAFDIPKPPRSLQTVTIQWGDVINSVAFSYTNQAGQKKNAGPWGGDNGAVTVMIKLAPSEVIKQVLGTTGKVGEDTVVASLTLVSNIRTYGPFGKANGTPFSSQVPDGKSVAGFYARAGASVNALGVYYA
ncbi:hypothetical protein BS78_K257900 [Paspalum vaginatum]|uniref:Dirigent protein n=1 Tax=Paspalum vaginatum TaxID=158149 RepID=A0A9W7XAG0_9POAL|nr:hypothetical protein BS78_K257900 [Paspalum vaginatum]